MAETITYLESIAAIYPDLRVEKCQLYRRSGQFNNILVINDEFIFRFPKYAEGVASLLNEVQLLTHLQGRVSFPIPNPVYMQLNAQMSSRVFLGYRLIPGEPLWRETLQTITDDQTLQRLADQLAHFLTELHHLPVDIAGEDFPIHDGPAEWARLYADIQQHLFSLMRPDARAWASRHFETYLSNPQLHQYPVCLRHGDFGSGNILHDPRARTISGIIDFGSAGLGDPALDIAAASSYGELFLRRFSRVYPEIDSLLERAQFYNGTYALQEALHGFRTNNREAFENGIAGYV